MTFEKIIELMENVSCTPYEIAIKEHLGGPVTVAWLQVWAMLPDSHTGKPSAQRGRHWEIDRNMDEGAIVRTALRAVLDFVEHETRESFKYKGRAVFSPHLDIELLHFSAAPLDARYAPPPRATSSPLNAEAHDFREGLTDSACCGGGLTITVSTGPCPAPEQVPPGGPRVEITHTV